jgi:hypothetical protein
MYLTMMKEEEGRISHRIRENNGNPRCCGVLIMSMVVMSSSAKSRAHGENKKGEQKVQNINEDNNSLTDIEKLGD